MNIQLLSCEVNKCNPRDSYKEQRKKPRIYVWPEGESIFENLNNRKSRPTKLYRQLAVAPALQALGLPSDTRVTWSQYAGCSCPCSPGFIVDACDYNVRGTSVHCSIGDPAEVAAKELAKIEEDRNRILIDSGD